MEQGLPALGVVKLQFVSHDYTAGEAVTKKYQVHVFKNTPTTNDKFAGLVYIDASKPSAEQSLVLVEDNLAESTVDNIGDIGNSEGVVNAPAQGGSDQWESTNW